MPSRKVTIAAGRPGEPAQHVAGPVLDRLRASDAAARQMLHQPEKERQITLGDATLIQGKDKIAAAGVNQEIRVLDALGYALVCQKLADVVPGEEVAEVFRPDVGIDSHGNLLASRFQSSQMLAAHPHGSFGIEEH